jgi:hypothetical protein
MNPTVRRAGGVIWEERKTLVFIQINCRSILNKSLDFWNLIDAYNPNVIIGMESWLREELSNVEVFRDEYTDFRRDRNTRGDGVFIYVKEIHRLCEIMGGRGFKDESCEGERQER